MYPASPTSPGRACLGPRGREGLADGGGWFELSFNHPPGLFRGTIADMIQKLSGQLSGARNKGEPGNQAPGDSNCLLQSPDKPVALSAPLRECAATELRGPRSGIYLPRAPAVA